MDIRQLRNLVFVARYSSFGIAADKLNVTQPALSKSIRALEQSLGVRLLDRGPWGVKPTEYGDRLIKYGETILALTDEARGEIDAMRGAQRGRIRVGAIATIVREILPTAARGFMARHPGVDLTLNEELSSALLGLLLNGRIDIAVMSPLRDFPSEELEYRDLLQIPIDIVADRNHPLAARESVSLADLASYRWILPGRPEPDRIALDALFAEARQPLPQVVCETTSSTFQISMLAGSSWLSYLTRTSVFTRGPDPQIVPLRLDTPTWTRNVGVAFRRRHSDRPVVNSFLRELDSICRGAACQSDR